MEEAGAFQFLVPEPLPISAKLPPTCDDFRSKEQRRCDSEQRSLAIAPYKHSVASALAQPRKPVTSFRFALRREVDGIVVPRSKSETAIDEAVLAYSVTTEAKESVAEAANNEQRVADGESSSVRRGVNRDDSMRCRCSNIRDTKIGVAGSIEREPGLARIQVLANLRMQSVILHELSKTKAIGIDTNPIKRVPGGGEWRCIDLRKRMSTNRRGPLALGTRGFSWINVSHATCDLAVDARGLPGNRPGLAPIQ